MDAILKSLTVYMMIGIVVVVGISQFNRVLGSILGILFWLAVGAVGTVGYERGGAIGLLGIEFSLFGFYAFCGAFTLFNAFNLWMSIQRKRRAAARRMLDED